MILYYILNQIFEFYIKVNKEKPQKLYNHKSEDSIQKIILDKNNERKIVEKGIKTSLFKVEFTSEKKTNYYKIKSFKVLFDNQIIYKKNKFIKIHN